MNQATEITLEQIREGYAREFNRFIAGDYKDLPQQVYNALGNAGVHIDMVHYLHISTQQPGMVAYTESDAKLVADRQTRVKFGKYLRKFHGDTLTEPQIATLAALLRGKVADTQLKIARTREDIARVYLDGPHSCMAGSANNFHSYPIHPAEVYATDDCAVAYIERDGNVTGRAVLNMVEKEWTTIYGDADNMRELLLENGYTSGDLAGCRLLYLTNGHGATICPYLDGGADMVTECGDYLQVDHTGDVCGAENTDGLLEQSHYAMCECCDEPIHDEYEANRTGDGEIVCEYCLGEHYSFAEDSQEYVQNDDCDHVYLPNGYFVHYDNVTSYGYFFDCVDNELYPDSEAIELHDGDVTHMDNAIWCEIDDCYALAADCEAYETADGETRYTIDSPDSDPDYRIKDMFKESA